MASLSDYHLYRADDGSPVPDSSPLCSQYVFESHVDEQLSLRRVRSVQDVVGLLSGGRRSADWFAVAGTALLYGNLLATGQWFLFLAFIVAGLLTAVLELRVAALSFAMVLVALLLETWREGELGLHWFAAVGVQVLFALIVLVVVLYLVQEDPRSYVLLPTEPHEEETHKGGDVVFRNRCCMDVKLLVFDGDDMVRLVPQGGLLGGHLLTRGASCSLGKSPPYIVKVYAPWENELGTFLVKEGAYNFRATAPPLVLLRGGKESFTNSTEAPVRICICQADCWCNSLWMPLAPLLARLARGTIPVAPGASVELHGPCTLRVYDAWGCSQRACCRTAAGESVEFVGSLRWTPARAGVGRSCSSLLNATF